VPNDDYEQHKGKVVAVHAMVVYGVADLQLFSSLTLALDGTKWSASCPGHLGTTERGPHTH
jgi:hypothetical protein